MRYIVIVFIAACSFFTTSSTDPMYLERRRQLVNNVTIFNTTQDPVYFGDVVRAFKNQGKASWSAYASLWNGTFHDNETLRGGIIRAVYMFATGMTTAAVNDAQLFIINRAPYANWSEDGWNVMINGHAYKRPYWSEKKRRLDFLASIFLIPGRFSKFTAKQKANARNSTIDIMGVPHQYHDLSVNINGTDFGAFNTKEQGSFHGLARIPNDKSPPPKDEVQNMTLQLEDVPFTAYLVPPHGVTILSDIDDILRDVRIWSWKSLILNSFANSYIPWMDMPRIYAKWARDDANTHFHYLSTCPEIMAEKYQDFLRKWYPPGSFDARSMAVADPVQLLRPREVLMLRALSSFRKRRFVLVGDNSNYDIMKAYPAYGRRYPGQVICVIIREVADMGSRKPPDIDQLLGLGSRRLVVFREPRELEGLRFNGTDCWGGD